MRMLKTFRLRFRSLFQRHRVEHELDAELRDHLERQIAFYRSAGLAPADARDAALREFGNVTLIRERCRDTRRVQWIEDMLSDLRYALRSLGRAPGHAAVAILSLALAIGANTAIFSLLNVLMLRDLPVANPHELLELGRATPNGRGSFSHPAYERLRDHNSVFSSVLAMSTNTLQATFDSAAQPLSGRFVSGPFFEVLGLTPAVGRLLSPADDRLDAAGGSALTVISYRLWQREFGGDPDAIGKTLRANEVPFQIVGVLPPVFEGLIAGRPDDFFVPLASAPLFRRQSWMKRPELNWLTIVGRTRPHTSIETVRANLDPLFALVVEEATASVTDPAEQRRMRDHRLTIDSARAGLAAPREQLSKPVLLLMAAVGLVLLIACANLVNLLLARGIARGREIGLRVAIGASRGRLLRQLLTESATLGVIGGGIGLALAFGGTRIIAALIADGDPAITFDLTPDHTVLAFTLLMSVGSAVAAGFAPAFRLVRQHETPVAWDARTINARSTTTGWGRLLIAAQVALSLLLLTGASLLVVSLRNLRAVDAGFEPEHVLLIGLYPGRVGLDGERLLGYYQQLLERARQTTGVRAASVSLITPISGGGVDLAFGREGGTRSDDVPVYVNGISDGFFATMGTPLLRGRDFAPQDGPNTPAVLVINDALARRYFKDENPIGQRVRLGSMAGLEIVGVVGNAKYLSLREEDHPTAYVHALQRPGLGGGTLSIRTVDDPIALAPRLRQEIQAVASAVPITQASLLSAQVERSLARERLVARILGAFAVVALLLAVVGLYGVLGYTVTQRTHEIGVRLALGSTRDAVLWAVLRESSMLVATGVAIGVPAALAVTRLLSSFLYGVTPTDPWVLATAVVCLFLAALMAAAVPAWRAATVDPVVALRCE